ncbi:MULTISPECIES: sensor domain-containing protein [Chromohalobacter]|uniref:EAL domain-containing protein n=2 Tax=Chromohalobacter TaxID=42054 RepID=A0A9X2X1Y2_9GAMM|nr:MULTISPECIES: GGDEF domain-containing phosphodiesterase [Chromohalobacter]MCK0767671.1 EAL domain-containing protein [Chromohalobacter canadensis]MCT8468734.1 EAL domain-containing protein [Chromohalobacter canadensis]MCT8471789.1 EAL domain-containing protein [Chromohalobacter canadensis]MCT8499242.1 EAL domain-containing protein [Chromohalobacter canadensis]MCT8505118.1 EAL domain-containing protein [Chromohalobacter moromii]
MAPHTLPASLIELLEVSGMALAIADGDQPGCPLIFVNKGFEQLTGYAREDVLGRSCRLLKTGDADPEANHRLHRAIEERTPLTLTLENRRKDGTRFDSELMLAPLYSQEGHCYLVSVQRDIDEQHQSRTRWRIQDRLLEQLSVQAPGVLFQYRQWPNGQGDFPYISPRLADYCGIDRDALQQDAETLLARIAPEDRQQLRDALACSATSLRLWQRAFRYHHPTRGLRWLECAAIPTRLANGGTLWHGYLTDVTARKLATERMALAETVFDSTHDGILVTDADKRIIDVNPAFTQLTGYSAEEALGRTPHLLSSGKHDAQFYTSLFATVHQQGYWTGDIWNVRKDGSQLIENVTISAIHDVQGTITHYIAVFRDITQKHLKQARMERRAIYDPLTSLFNRDHFGGALENLLSGLSYTGIGVAVLFIDLDDFKPINDTYGHAAGDEALVIIAQRLKQQTRSTDLVARLGGDEFVIALAGMRSAEKAEKVAFKILDDLVSPISLRNEHSITLSASVGVAYTEDSQFAANALIAAADSAMYEAKSQGKNRVAMSQRHPSDGYDLYTRLQSALEKEELALFYQPILSLADERIVSFEALVRWHHPDQGLLAPHHFIDIVNHSSLERAYSSWLVHQAARTAQRFQACHMAVTVSINVTRDQVESGQLAEDMAQARKRHALASPFLNVEVVETAQFHDVDLAHNQLQQARRLGAQIALDDFGSGVSSLTYASQLPIDIVKIDQAVIRHLVERPQQRRFVSGIIDMAHAMQRIVLAEGVETPEQLDVLRHMGCDMAQGFLIGHPMPSDELEAHYLAGTTQLLYPLALQAQ